MVVDDDDDLRDAICEALRDVGYQTLEVRGGQDALDQLKAGVRPDLLLLDLMMPGLSGRDVWEALRGDPVLGKIPVVFISAARRVACSPRPSTPR